MMKYPGGVSKSELEVRLRALEVSVRRLLAEQRGELQGSVNQIVGTALDNVVWNSIGGRPSEFPPEPHTHAEVDVTDLDKYTQAEVDALLAGIVFPDDRPWITYRQIPEETSITVGLGEQYLVYDELVVDGEIILDGGEIVVL
jgi:hypothetical protein